MVNQRKSLLSIETTLYLTACLLALGFRLIRLGDLPLGDQEARLALQAFNLSQSGQVGIGGAPAYLSLTTILFFLLGESNWLARFIPVLAGSLLVVVPLLFKKHLGRKVAIGLAFLLAFDPVLVASSRQVDARILALTGLVATLGFFLRRDAVKSGMGLGLAILSGAFFWQGGLGLLVTWLIHRVFHFENRNDQVSQVGAYDAVIVEDKRRFNTRQAVIWGLGTLVVVGSLFLIKPVLLSGAAEGFGDFASAYFGGATGVPIGLFLFGGLVSNPLGVVLAVAESVRVLRRWERVGVFLVVWWLVALLMAILNPARQAVDLALPAIPMLALCARGLVRVLHLRGEKVVFYAYAMLSFVLIASVWLNGIGVISAWNEAERNSRIAALLASVFLLLAATFLVIWGWGISVTGRGFRMGAMAILVLVVLSTAWRAAGLGTLPENELLRIDPIIKDYPLLADIMENFSKWKTGETKVLDVGVMGLKSPALEWLLRRNRQVTYAEGFSANSPSILITPRKTELGLSVSYSGQALTWNMAPTWSQFTADQWLKWLAFREAPAEKQIIQLWVRTDVFPGATPLNLGK